MRAVLLFFLLSFSAWGTDSCPKTAQAISLFEKGFTDEKIYKPAECDANAKRLLTRLHDEGVDISTWRVLYLFGPAGMVVRHARDPLAEWPYHAVVMGSGLIFDLDFGKTPRVLSVDEYVKANFGGPVMILDLPGPDFLRHFDTPGFRKWAQDNFSIVPLADFLKKL